jgi:hypothetical protein
MEAHMPDADRAASYFDPAQAQFPTRTLPLASVIDLLSVTHAPERIAQYRSAMQRGERFPPIAVVRVGGRFLVADGHKRLSAFRALSPGPIVVEVWPVRRWLRDQWQQLARKTGQHVRLVRRGFRDPRARREARRLALDTIGHWRRMLRSLRSPR